jgi:hypothetical protein
MVQWEGWFHQLEATGDADPGLAVRMFEAAAACVRALCLLGVNVPTFRGKSADELLEQFPRDPWPNLDPPWQRDEAYRQRTKDLLHSETWRTLLADLLGFLQLLKIAPGVASQTPPSNDPPEKTGERDLVGGARQQVASVKAGSGTPKGGNKRKKAGGKPPLEKSNPLQFQVYERIRQAHQAGGAYTDTVGRLRGDKDFMEQLVAAGLGKLTTGLVKRALAFFDQRKREKAGKKQETDPA